MADKECSAASKNGGGGYRCKLDERVVAILPVEISCKRCCRYFRLGNTGGKDGLCHPLPEYSECGIPCNFSEKRGPGGKIDGHGRCDEKRIGIARLQTSEKIVCGGDKKSYFLGDGSAFFTPLFAVYAESSESPGSLSILEERFRPVGAGSDQTAGHTFESVQRCKVAHEIVGIPGARKIDGYRAGGNVPQQ